MKITFLGATKTVTGSNFLLEGAGKKFLVDCGMYQGHGNIEEKNYDDFMFDVEEIDFMLLTHAHIDHSGRIPKLYKAGYRNPIYAQKATCDLCSIMLPDSGHIQEMEAEWKNKKRKRQGKDPYIPMYTAQDAVDSLEVFKPVNNDEITEIIFPWIKGLAIFNGFAAKGSLRIVELSISKSPETTVEPFTALMLSVALAAPVNALHITPEAITVSNKIPINK